MSTNYARALIGICCALSACFMGARAIPHVAFPFNSQVPTVARIEQQYSFRLSESTFTQDPASLVYSLETQPAWLTFDGATRTFEGTPGRGDEGAVAFILVAADSTGAVQMPCTLVISSDPAPQLAGDIGEQLAETTNLSSLKPAVVTLVPATDFKFDFEPGSFIDIVQRKLYYYATLSDHTPLPSWLVFNSAQLEFTGTAPDLSAFPQSWTIDMIASDVAGFTGTSAAFTIAIAKQQLAFVPDQQDVTVTGGESITISILKDQLFRDNVRIEPDDLADATASLPSWLQFDKTTLRIEGDAPTNVTTQNITVSVTDSSGNSATAIINMIMGNISYFDRQVGRIEARAGESLEYKFKDSLFSQDDLELSINLPEAADWLLFDTDTHELNGKVPTSAEDTTIKATLLAKPSGSKGSQAQVFTIDIQANTASSTSAVAADSTNRSSTPTASANTPTFSPTAAAESSESKTRIKTGPIVAIAILGVALTAILIITAIFCFRRRRARRKESFTPQKSTISRPMPSPEPENIVITRPIHGDLEKLAEFGGTPARQSTLSNDTEQPPQLAALELPSQEANRLSRWSKRFSRMSQASSMGVGAEMIMADSNIPEWGRPSAAMSAPHDSFSIPAEMARVSRQLSDTSPSKRALHRIRDRNRNSAHDGLERTAAGGMARHSSARCGMKHRGQKGSLGLSTTREASSMSSFTTRGTSVLSTQTTLPSEFPRPPSTAVSLPTLSILEAGKRKSYRRSGIRNSTIRMVARSDSIKEDRPLDEKRQSFIRNRASKSGIQSPLFAHGSRGSSSANAQLNGRASTNFSSIGSIRRSQQILTSQSESSTMEPQLRDSRRFSQRVRSVFAPNFPRALTRSTLFPDEDRIPEGASSSGFSTTSESVNSSDDWVHDLPKPRNERNFVLPGEASPTPPPAQAVSRRGSSMRGRKLPAEGDVPVQNWKKRMYERSSSPLSSQVYTTVMDRSSPLGSRSQRRRKSFVGEPQSLVSADSMHKSPRLRLARTNLKLPVSVEADRKRFSSVRVDQGLAQAGAGSEQWEESDSEDDLRDAGLMPVIPVGGDRTGTQKSDMSGPAFL